MLRSQLELREAKQKEAAEQQENVSDEVRLEVFGMEKCDEKGGVKKRFKEDRQMEKEKRRMAEPREKENNRKPEDKQGAQREVMRRL